MGDEGDIWRAKKDYDKKVKEKYENRIAPIVSRLIKHKDCKEVGDHWRIGGEWDFWWTGTVFNIKTKQHSDVKELIKKFNH